MFIRGYATEIAGILQWVEMVEQHAFLRNIGDDRLRRVGDDAAGLWRKDAHHQLQRGGFSRSAGSHQGDDVTGILLWVGKTERDVVEDLAARPVRESYVFKYQR